MKASNDKYITIADKFDTNLHEVEQTLPGVLKEAQKHYDDLLSENITLEDINNSPTLE